MKRSQIILALAVGLGACAEDVPGVPPPDAQVYFPIGIEIVPAVTRGNVLAVLSSNFDQRYNAGHLGTFDPAALVTLAKQAPSDGDSIRFQDDFGDAFINQVKLRQFGGDLMFVPPATNSTDGRLFVAHRGRNVVTMTSLRADGTVACDNPGIDPIPGFDCTPAHEVPTSADDPYALAYAATKNRPGATRGTFLLGHLLTRAVSLTPLTDVLLFDVGGYEARLDAEANGADFLTDRAGDDEPTDDVLPFERILFERLGGIASVAWAPGAFGKSTDDGAFIVAGSGLLAGVGGGLRVFAIQYDLDDGPANLQISTGIPLDTRTSAIQTRGVSIGPVSTTATATTARRAYVSVRFPEGNDIDSFNAGIMVFDLEGEDVKLLSVYEIGEELTRPSLVSRADGTQLLYVPDIRLNRIFIVDVTADLPQLVGTIAGLANRRIDGENVQVRGLASPAQMTIADVDGGTYGFVSNFANSTLAILDLSNPDPRQHKLIARLGRNIDAEGDMEMPK